MYTMKEQECVISFVYFFCQQGKDIDFQIFFFLYILSCIGIDLIDIKGERVRGRANVTKLYTFNVKY